MSSSKRSQTAQIQTSQFIFPYNKRKQLSPKQQEGRQRLLEKRIRRHEESRKIEQLLAAKKTQRSDNLRNELQAEIAKRQIRRVDYQKSQAMEIRKLIGDKRPNKPTELVQKNADQNNLTAHHLFPYNRIREDFANTLENGDIKSFQNILSFSGKSGVDSSDAFRFMAFQKEHIPSESWKKHQKSSREEQKKIQTNENKGNLPLIVQDPTPDSSSRRLNTLFQETTWAKHNIFMGPIPAKRADDPHEGLDTKHLQTGGITKSSSLAERMFNGKGFGEIEPTEFHQLVQAARFDSEKHRPFNANDWHESNGKYSQIIKK